MEFKKVKTGDKDLDAVQDNIEAALITLAAKPLKDAVLAEDIVLTTTNTAVRHGLTGPVRGWVVVKQTSAITVYNDTAHTEPTQFIYLKSSSSATVTLLFF